MGFCCLKRASRKIQMKLRTLRLVLFSIKPPHAQNQSKLNSKSSRRGFLRRWCWNWAGPWRVEEVRKDRKKRRTCWRSKEVHRGREWDPGVRKGQGRSVPDLVRWVGWHSGQTWQESDWMWGLGWILRFWREKKKHTHKVKSTFSRQWKRATYNIHEQVWRCAAHHGAF